MHILMVCTANICRSPMAEGFLRDALVGRGFKHTVSSAGFLYDGRAAEKRAIKAAARFDVDIGAHVSTKLTPTVVEKADLILTMERDHARKILMTFREQSPVVFPLKTFIRTARGKPRQAAQSPQEYVQALSDARDSSALLGIGSGEDVADPIGRSMRAFRTSAEEINSLCLAAVSAIGPDGP